MTEKKKGGWVCSGLKESINKYNNHDKKNYLNQFQVYGKNKIVQKNVKE